ncbi:DedA family protein [Paraneptunicella aestuarii]|uniref:YqaA family protein n=1 Tax=Paraneptunicella aestuarii TaxID=2831148 RepID=UPI001E4838BE|nr:YqaA family protein [Paraneptunicella aestuarii]UAA38122.1 DedA family protein [Paraneptunicella aestuarii]
MKLFQHLYNACLRWAKHKHAQYYLFVMGFSESVFFPIPPDVMLAPMSLAKPQKAWFYAMITTLSSVLGGIFGYMLGAYAFESYIQPLIVEWGYQGKLELAISWFKEYGIGIVFLAGFSPIPYKIFTLSAGFLNMAFLPFIVVSAISRGMRFYLVAGLMYWGGEKMEEKLRQYIDWIGWITIALAIVAYFIFR